MREWLHPRCTTVQMRAQESTGLDDSIWPMESFDAPTSFRHCDGHAIAPCRSHQVAPGDGGVLAHGADPWPYACRRLAPTNSREEPCDAACFAFAADAASMSIMTWEPLQTRVRRNSQPPSSLMTSIWADNVGEKIGSSTFQIEFRMDK